MKVNLLNLIFLGAFSAFGQQQITNGDFESWGNPSPGNADEPTSWYSNKTGSSVASIGPQTCFKETTDPHSGTACVRIETKYYILAVVNGNMTTGIVNAPSQNKAEGYIGTVKHNSTSDQRRMAFTGRPDSLVGWYKYTQATSGTGASAEKGKVRAILHSGDFFDPEAPVNGNHMDLSANKIGEADFFTDAANTTQWKRFSVPFNYVKGDVPAFIMINTTSSENQLTTAPGSSGTGSKMWLDDLKVIYNTPPTTGVSETEKNDFKVYSFDRTIYVDFSEINTPSELTVLDITGKVVYSKSMETGQMNQVQLPSSLSGGTYLYRILGAEVQKSGKLNIK